MVMYDLIEKKRYGKELSKEEISFIVNGYTLGQITDAQMSSFLMAVTIHSMTDKETYFLTKCMQNSGESIHLGLKAVDKHSTGGVSDTTTLIITPILACLNVLVAKMSGRSLGFTGGTIDKLEVFPGYIASQNLLNFKKLIKQVGCSIVSQSAQLAPADKLIYALRDKTATVDSIPLIASSVMSKKLACGASIILLDVKYGSGAFMKKKSDAINLAKLMVKIGKMDGKEVFAIVSNMNVPLDSGIGCVDEVKCALDILKGNNTTSKLAKLSKQLVKLLYEAYTGIHDKDIMQKIEEVIHSGKAIEKLAQMIECQGGDASYVMHTELMPHSKYTIEWKSDKAGYVHHIDAYKIAKVVQHLKSMNISNELKPTQGLKLTVDVGSRVNANQILCYIHTNSKNNLDDIIKELESAFVIKKSRPREQKLIAKVIR